MADPIPEPTPTPDRSAPEWLGRLAHDLRNPITPMRSAVQLLQLGQLPPEVAPDLLRTLDRQLDVLLHLIDDVSDLVKIERGGFELRLATCDLGQVVASAVARHAKTMGQGSRAAPEILFDAPPAPVWVLADEVRLRQAVEQLLGLLANRDVAAPASVRVDEVAGAGRVCFADGGRTLAPDARVDFLAGGPVPIDPAALTFGHLVARRILADHRADVAFNADGCAIALTVPRADPSA
jgi:K+-sensing histidine kinase KdpD